MTAITMLDPKSLQPAIKAIYKKAWGERNVENVDKPQGLADALRRAIGEELTKKVMEKISTAEVKQQLNKYGEEALEQGAFGMPWFVGEWACIIALSLRRRERLTSVGFKRRTARGRGSLSGDSIISDRCAFSWDLRSRRRVEAGRQCFDTSS